MRVAPALRVVALFAFAIGCDSPSTNVVLDNAYAPSTANVVYRAFWQAVPFTTPLAPGASSDPQSTVAASPNVAYALLAPGWDPSSGAAPASFVVLESRLGFEVHLNETLHIPVDDSRFAGNCAAGSALSQAEADFVTQRVFADSFAGLVYDAPTCATTSAP